MVEERFQELAQRWLDETMFLSDSTKALEHEALQQIIKMGPEALPLIFERLRKAPEHWFHALATITEQDPTIEVPPGDIQGLAQAWLQWAEGQGFGEPITTLDDFDVVLRKVCQHLLPDKRVQRRNSA